MKESKPTISRQPRDYATLQILNGWYIDDQERSTLQSPSEYPIVSFVSNPSHRCNAVVRLCAQEMSFADGLMLGIRWIHTMAAVAWVGGGIFYLFVIRPATRQAGENDSAVRQAMGQEFRGIVNTSIAILIVTGTMMSFNRLTSDFVGVPYVSVLVAKIVLAFYTFYLVRFLHRGSYPEEIATAGGQVRRITSMLSGTTAILIVGVIVFLLADVLQSLFESGLSG